jgi:hypothetical protein
VDADPAAADTMPTWLALCDVEGVTERSEELGQTYLTGVFR